VAALILLKSMRNPAAADRKGQTVGLASTLPIVAVVLISALLTACGAAVPTLPATGKVSPAPSAGGPLTSASDSDNGKTLNLAVGDQLEVRLGSTYWTFNGSSNPAVLKAVGPAVISPQPSGCVAGGGCGFAIATFQVVASGSAQVTASRVSCGEAMGCTAAQDSYRVTVVANP
jgi:hypothetical protein